MSLTGAGPLLNPTVAPLAPEELGQIKATSFVTFYPVTKGDTYEKIGMACGVPAPVIRAFPLTRWLHGTSDDPLDAPKTPLLPKSGWVVVPWPRHKLFDLYRGYARLREMNLKLYHRDAELTYDKLTADLDHQLMVLDLVAMAATLPVSVFGGALAEVKTVGALKSSRDLPRVPGLFDGANDIVERGFLIPRIAERFTDPTAFRAVVILVESAANLLGRSSTLAPTSAGSAPRRAKLTGDRPARFPKPKEPDQGFWFYLRHGTGGWNPSWWAQFWHGYKDHDWDLVMHGTDALKRRSVERLRDGAMLRDWEFVQRRNLISSQLNQSYYGAVT